MSNNEQATARVVAVLLADGWHQIVPGSFSVGPLGMGAGADPGVPGFWFEEADSGRPYEPAVLAGPLEGIIAVRQVTSPARRVGDLDRARAAHNGQRADHGARLRMGAGRGMPRIAAPTMTTSTAAARPACDRRPDWRDNAACRYADPELFFPDGDTRSARAQVKMAKLICRRCPVSVSCLSWALASGQEAGIWGGLTEDQRHRLRRRGRGFWPAADSRSEQRP